MFANFCLLTHGLESRLSFQCSWGKYTFHEAWIFTNNPGPASKGSPARATDNDRDHSATPVTPGAGGGEDRTKATRSRIKKMMKEFVMGEVSNDSASGSGLNAVDTLWVQCSHISLMVLEPWTLCFATVIIPFCPNAS